MEMIQQTAEKGVRSACQDNGFVNQGFPDHWQAIAFSQEFQSSISRRALAPGCLEKRMLTRPRLIPGLSLRNASSSIVTQ